MDLTAMIDEHLVKYSFDAQSKNDVIHAGAQLMYESGKINNKEKYINAVLEREKECATGIGMGIAIPHCKDDSVNQAGFALIKLAGKIEWESLDDEPVDYVIMLAAPNTPDNVHLKMLSSLAAGLMDDDFRDALKAANTIEDLRAAFKLVA